MPATSLPERGSVTPAAPKISPCASGRSQRSFCSCVPNVSMLAPTRPDGIDTNVPMIWQVLEISSISWTKVT